MRLSHVFPARKYHLFVVLQPKRPPKPDDLAKSFSKRAIPRVTVPTVKVSSSLTGKGGVCGVISPVKSEPDGARYCTAQSSIPAQAQGQPANGTTFPATSRANESSRL